MGPTVKQENIKCCFIFYLLSKRQQLSYSFTFVSQVNFPNLPHCCDKCFQSVSASHHPPAWLPPAKPTPCLGS